MKARLVQTIRVVYGPGTVLHYEVRGKVGERTRWVLVTYSDAYGMVVPASKGGKRLNPDVRLVVGDNTMSPGTLLHLAGFELEDA